MSDRYPRIDLPAGFDKWRDLAMKEPPNQKLIGHGVIVRILYDIRDDGFRAVEVLKERTNADD